MPLHNREKFKYIKEDLRLHTSYSREILLDILYKYISFYHPKWEKDDDILKALENQLPDILPAPHNIEFFVRSSENHNSLKDVLQEVQNLNKWSKH